MPKKAPQIERGAFVDAYDRYKAVNPEFARPMSARAEIIWHRVFCDADDKFLPMKEVLENIEIFRIRILAIIPQLEQSSHWQEALTAAKMQAEQTLREQYPQAEPEALEAVLEGREFNLPYAPELSRPIKVANSEYEFKRAPRTFIKTMQKVLTSETERLAIGLDDPDVLPDRLDLSGLVIDPALINYKLLENLGLDEYKPKKRSGKVGKIAAHANAIPAIKEMLDRLEPFKLSYEEDRSGLHCFRLMRIGGGKNEGYLLGTQSINDKTVLFKTDLHGAYRRIDHIRDEYSQEIKTLENIVDGIHYVDRKVATQWHEMKESGELDEIKQKLLALAGSLKFVQNKHKVHIQTVIMDCSSLQTETTLPAKFGQDSEGKKIIKRPKTTRMVLNPGANRAKWNTLPVFVTERKNEIRSIISYLADDQVVIESYIRQQEAPFFRFYQTVEAMHGKFKILNTGVPMAPMEVAKITRNLNDIKEDCISTPSPGTGRSSAFFEPYASFARRMVRHIDSTVALLDEENIDRGAAAAEFTKIYLVTKIQYFFHKLQEFYDNFLSPHKTPYFKEMLVEIDKLDQLITEKRVDSKVDGELIKTPEYDKLFARIHGLITALRAQTETAVTYMAERARASDDAGKNEKEKEALKIKARMHKMIKKFRFEKLLTEDPAIAADKSASPTESSSPTA